MAIEHDSLLRILLAERASLLAFLRSIVRRRELAEDGFQEICLLALQKREQIVDEKHLPAWLRTTARFWAMNALRKQKTAGLLLDTAVLDLLESNWREHEQVGDSAISSALQRCMAQLSDKAKSILHSRYAQGMSVAEIAIRDGRPEKSVFVSFSRIHGALHDCIYARLSVTAISAKGGGGHG